MIGNNKKGFSLIEILVTITIFSIIMTAFLGLFSSAFKNQQKNLSVIQLLNNTSYISEYMSRALRMAKKDLGAVCIGEKDNFEITAAGIKFLNYQGECQEFFLENQTLKVSKDGIIHALTSASVEVENLNFEILGQTQIDFLQPRISFALTLKTIKTPVREIKLQTTVSQRDLDVLY